MEAETLTPEIREMLADHRFAEIKSALGQWEPADVAELVDSLEAEEQAVLFRLLGRDVATEVFSLLPSDSQEDLITRMGQAPVAAILNKMSPDDRTELLEEVPGELAQRLLNMLRGEEREIAQSLLNYPEDSVGRLMTPEYVAVRPDWTMAQVIEHIRKVSPEKETVHHLFVVDAKWKLLDRIGLHEVILAAPGSEVESLMAGPDEEPALDANEDRETAVELFKKYDASTLPVVDGRGVMVGIVTSDDVLDVQEEEDTEDFQKMVGVAALEQPYFQTPYLQMVGKRLPWLAFLLAAELLTALAIMAYQESMREHIWLLVLFLPLVNASAGNVGSQMAGLAIRGLAVQELDLGDWSKIALRELGMGLSLGSALAVLGYAAAVLFGRPNWVAMTLAAAMLGALTVANLAGAMIPLVLKRLRLDPAVTSAPLIASMMDILSVVIYFGTAMAFLRLFG